MPCSKGLRGDGGKLCPEIEHMPATAEGRAVAATLDRVGVWRYAGMSGILAGLDITEAMASVPADCDPEKTRRLFVSAERAFVAEWQKHQKSETTDG